MPTSSTNLWQLVATIEADFRRADSAIDHNERKLNQLIRAYQNAERSINASARRTGATLSTSSATSGERQQASAAASLQRQRSAALIAEWKRQTREHENQLKQQTRDAENAAKARERSVIAASRRVERERVRIARESERELQRLSAPRGGGISGIAAGAVGGLTALVGFSAVSSIRQGVSAWFEYASSLEATRIAFTTMLGSAEAANDHLRDLQRFALATPFEFPELVAASQRMQALGFSATQVVPILNDVGNAVAAAGGGGERLDRVVLALAQMQSKGKVATQEMNQLAEAGLPAWKMLEQQFGKSRAELVKLVEQGKISSDVFLQAFQTFSQNNFGGLMEKQSKTAIGALSNIKDAVLALAEESLRPTFQMIADKLLSVAQSLETNKAQWTAWGNTIASTVNFVLTQLGHIVRGAELVAEGFRKTFGQGSFFGDMIKGETTERFLSLPNGQVINLSTREVFNVDAQGRMTSTKPNANTGSDVDSEYAVAGGPGQYSVGAGVGVVAKRKTAVLPGGGGGGRGGQRDLIAEQRRVLEASLRGTLESLEGEEAGVRRSYERRTIIMARHFSAISQLEAQRHQHIMDTLNAEIELAKKIKDPREQQLALLDLGTQKQREMNRHTGEEWRIQQEIKGVSRERIVLADTLIQRLTREREVLKEIRQERSRFASEISRTDLGDSSFEMTPELRDRTGRPRIATPELQAERERLAILEDRVRTFAANLTYTIESALREGFRGGIKAGILEFGLGLLEMAQHQALKALENAIAKALLGGDAAAGGGGGNWLGKLLGIAIGGLTGGIGGIGGGGSGSTGGIGGAAGGIGGLAEGGHIKPFGWSWVGERGPELVRAGRAGATVLSNEESMRQAAPTINMTVYATDAQSFARRETQTQIRHRMMRELRAA